MGNEIVFAAYRPRKGREEDLLALVRRHHPTLLRLGLATARTPVVSRAKDGTIVEIFEWVSAEAAQKAHDHPEVRALWGPMEEVAGFAALASLEESKHPFPHFLPVP